LHSKIIFIAGGAGYIGSKLIEKSLKKNYQVICYDNLVYGKKSIKSFIKNKKFTFILGDIRDDKKIKSILQKNSVDYVVNLASIVGDKQCKTIPKTAYDINYFGNQVLFNNVKKYCKNIKKYIFASTCSNYGIVLPNEFAKEDSKLSPMSLYAESKIDSENFLKKNQSKKFDIIVLRFATAYGLSYRTRFDLTINSFTYEAIKFKKLHIFSKDTWRPFIHVDDMANIILKSFEITFKKRFSVYNAGYTKNNFSKKKIVEKICKSIKNKIDIEYIDAVIDRRDYRVNCDKIKKDFKLSNCENISKAIYNLIRSIKLKKITDQDIKNNLLDANCATLKKFYK
jgi:nucleoside-diphosphate-sugar epimerase